MPRVPAHWKYSIVSSCFRYFLPLEQEARLFFFMGVSYLSLSRTPLHIAARFSRYFDVTELLRFLPRSERAKAEGFGVKTESARARSFCFKSERTSVPSGTPRSERERARTEETCLWAQGCSNRRGPKQEGEHETVNKVSLRAQERRAHFSSPSRLQRRAAPGPRRPCFSFLLPLLTRGVSGERDVSAERHSGASASRQKESRFGCSCTSKSTRLLVFFFHGTRHKVARNQKHKVPQERGLIIEERKEPTSFRGNATWVS